MAPEEKHSTIKTYIKNKKKKDELRVKNTKEKLKNDIKPMKKCSPVKLLSLLVKRYSHLVKVKTILPIDASRMMPANRQAILLAYSIIYENDILHILKGSPEVSETEEQ